MEHALIPAVQVFHALCSTSLDSGYYWTTLAGTQRGSTEWYIADFRRTFWTSLLRLHGYSWLYFRNNVHPSAWFTVAPAGVEAVMKVASSGTWCASDGNHMEHVKRSSTTLNFSSAFSGIILVDEPTHGGRSPPLFRNLEFSPHCRSTIVSPSFISCRILFSFLMISRRSHALV